MSASSATNIDELPAITQTLRKIIKDNTVSCESIGDVPTQGLPEVVTYNQVATVDNIRAYISCDPAYSMRDKNVELPRGLRNLINSFADDIRAQAPKLFVLTVAHNYPLGFVHSLIKFHYHENAKRGTGILTPGTDVDPEYEELRTRAVEDQAVVCADGIVKGQWDHEFLPGGLPFSYAKRNDEHKKLHPGALAGWDVTLDTAFQPEKFETEDFALTSHVLEPIYGREKEFAEGTGSVAGLMASKFYFLLWEKKKVEG